MQSDPAFKEELKPTVQQNKDQQFKSQNLGTQADKTQETWSGKKQSNVEQRADKGETETKEGLQQEGRKDKTLKKEGGEKEVSTETLKKEEGNKDVRAETKKTEEGSELSRKDELKPIDQRGKVALKPSSEEQREEKESKPQETTDLLQRQKDASDIRETEANELQEKSPTSEKKIQIQQQPQDREPSKVNIEEQTTPLTETMPEEENRIEEPIQPAYHEPFKAHRSNTILESIRLSSKCSHFW